MASPLQITSSHPAEGPEVKEAEQMQYPPWQCGSGAWSRSESWWPAIYKLCDLEQVTCEPDS